MMNKVFGDESLDDHELLDEDETLGDYQCAFDSDEGSCKHRLWNGDKPFASVLDACLLLTPGGHRTVCVCGKCGQPIVRGPRLIRISGVFSGICRMLCASLVFVWLYGVLFLSPYQTLPNELTVYAPIAIVAAIALVCVAAVVCTLALRWTSPPKIMYTKDYLKVQQYERSIFRKGCDLGIGACSLLALLALIVNWLL